MCLFQRPRAVRTAVPMVRLGAESLCVCVFAWLIQMLKLTYRTASLLSLFSDGCDCGAKYTIPCSEEVRTHMTDVAARGAVRGMGGILAVCWLLVGVVTAIAVKRVMRLRYAPPIIYAYAPAKAAVLGAIILWAVMEVFFSIWWINPRANTWPAIATSTIVEGLCRPVVFGAIVVHWRTPLSNYVVKQASAPLTTTDGVPQEQQPAVRAVAQSEDSALVLHPGRGSRAKWSSLDTEPRRDAEGPASHHVRVETPVGPPAAAALPGDGGEEPSSSSDPVAVAPAIPLGDEAAMQKRLRGLVVSRTRVIAYALVIVTWFVLHIVAAAVEGAVTSSSGGVQWCGLVTSDPATNVCIVPLVGAVPTVTAAASSATVPLNNTNASKAGGTPTPLPGLVTNTANVEVHVVQSPLLVLATFGQSVLILALWVVSGRTHERSLISRAAIRRFRPFLRLTSLALFLGAVMALPPTFTTVRTNGSAYSAVLLIRGFTDLAVIALLALRAFRQRHVDVATAAISETRWGTELPPA